MVSLDILRQVSCFQHLEIDQLTSIAGSGELRRLEKDAFLFRAGDRAEALYIVISGSLAVSREDAKGKRLQLAIIEPGAFLGEMGLSQGSPRSADVSAMTESMLLFIHRSQFDRLIREQPAFALSLLAGLSKKLQEANQRLENRVAMSVKERLWSMLNSIAEAGSITPAPKVTQLAAQIDATREMTSKAHSMLIRENRVAKESSNLWRIR